MISNRQLFLQHVAQTNELPLMLEVDYAEGIYIYDKKGKRYFDLNSGINVSSIGHRHPAVIQAIHNQADKHLHTMVYGEHIQSPQIAYAQLLCKQLPASLQSVYFVMTGTEAVEGAMKLAKRYTSRPKIIACSNAYHGSTQGAESLRSDEEYKSAFYPLLPGILHIQFNSMDDIQLIDEDTAAVILEPVQAEAGVITPKNNYLQHLKKRCSKKGVLLILDEIQTGFGRTGSMFAFQQYGFEPDILLLGKAMGGGVPLAAFISSNHIMKCLIKNPALGHISTFAGHPLSCAAGKATLETLISKKISASVFDKAQLFIQKLNHPIVKEIRYSGLMMAVELTRRKYLKHVVQHAFENGAIVDYFLFNKRSFRLAPPLVITSAQIEEASKIILKAMDYAKEKYL